MIFHKDDIAVEIIYEDEAISFVYHPNCAKIPFPKKIHKVFYWTGEKVKEDKVFMSKRCECEFLRMVREGKNKVNELSQEFGVSTLALRIRAKNLGMSGHGL